MFDGKCSNNLVVKTHDICLRAVYNTKTESYRDLLHIYGETGIHKQKIQLLVIKISKGLNKLSRSFAWNYYNQKKKPYNLRRKHLLKLNM